ERLQMTNKFLDSIVENIPNMIFVKDAEQLRFDRINRAGEELLGLSRGVFLGKNDFDFFPPEQAQFFTSKDREVLKQNVVVDIPEEPIETAHGRRWLHTKKIPVFDDQGTPRYLLGISEDITERKQLADRLQQAHEELERRVEDRTADLVKANDELQREIAERQKATEALGRSEEQLRQAQKMEAIGRLAGGIAHDFNNMLSVILGYSALIGSELAQNDPVRGDLREIEKAASRAADLTKQLLAFSRQQVMAPKIVNLNEVIAGMDKMLRRVIGEDVELRIVPTPHVGRVKVDPGQIEQVILNLVVNARDAMPNGGMLTIETGNAEIDEKYAAEHIGAKPGAHVMLAVTDTGIGMDAPTQARIFEPFFTTKEQGKGTGLGLSTVFGIVQQSQGTIWLYSEPGRGTSFKVYLPRTREIADVLSTHSSAPPAARGSETILLVEDEEQVRVLARNILKKNGYQVIEAQNAGEALLLCERFSGKIHLLVTDVVMPKVSGRELVERLSPQRPEMKVLFMSGYTDDTVVHHGVLDAGIHYLQKPLTPDALGRKVREVLDL
ncbi:MAG TPA: ATP-binding protein, partial [Polyangiaceae bacterium]